MENAYKIFCENMIKESKNSMPAISIGYARDGRKFNLKEEIDKYLNREEQSDDARNHRKNRQRRT